MSVHMVVARNKSHGSHLRLCLAALEKCREPVRRLVLVLKTMCHTMLDKDHT